MPLGSPKLAWNDRPLRHRWRPLPLSPLSPRGHRIPSPEPHGRLAGPAPRGFLMEFSEPIATFPWFDVVIVEYVLFGSQGIS